MEMEMSKTLNLNIDPVENILKSGLFFYVPVVMLTSSLENCVFRFLFILIRLFLFTLLCYTNFLLPLDSIYFYLLSITH